MEGGDPEAALEYKKLPVHAGNLPTETIKLQFMIAPTRIGKFNEIRTDLDFHYLKLNTKTEGEKLVSNNIARFSFFLLLKP